MAALLTSVIDNGKKVSEYIIACRNMGIKLLPPDINQGEAGFSVSGDSICYALTAIKGVGRSVIDSIVEERNVHGEYKNLKDFIIRIEQTDVNKRTIENFIKAGALDSLHGSRRQFMSMYGQILDHVARDRKNNLTGQISLFDIAEEDQKEEFDLQLPEVAEYPKEMRLAFEKEVLGIYVSGHPMEEYQELWSKYVSHNTNDFALDEETGSVNVPDQARVTLGGMIADKSIKYTKNDQVMAFLVLEDLVGSVEVIVFPKSYEKYGALLMEDAKVFIRGRASLEEDRDGKLICEEVRTFADAADNGWNGNNKYAYKKDNAPKTNDTNGMGNRKAALPDGIWLQFEDVQDYESRESGLMNIITYSEGSDNVVIFLKSTKEIKVLPPEMRVNAGEELLNRLKELFGEANVRLRK